MDSVTDKYTGDRVMGEAVSKVSSRMFVEDLAFSPIKKGSVSVYVNQKLLFADFPHNKYKLQIPFKWALNYENGLIIIKFQDPIKGKVTVDYTYRITNEY